MTPDTEYHRWLFEARLNRIPFRVFRRRIERDKWSGERAATETVREGRSVSPSSITSRCKRARISRDSFYSVREELIDLGCEFDTQDVIDICKARAKK